MNTEKSQETAAEQNKFAQAKVRLASHPEAQPETLAKLSDRDVPEVLERVAENSQTPADVLVKLSEHAAPEVRSAVTENVNTPIEVLHKLAEDEHPDVRMRIAENPNAPARVLNKLAEDENPYVVAKATETLKSSRSIREQADEMLLAERFVEAENLYRELISGLVSLLGCGHHEVAEAKHKLAAALGGQGKTEEAATFEEEARVVQEVLK